MCFRARKCEIFKNIIALYMYPHDYRFMLFQENECPYSHNALPPRKMELCKFYLIGCCAKKDKCLYMHSDFPCKFFHSGLKCIAGNRCKFSHGKLSEPLKDILLKVCFVCFI